MEINKRSPKKELHSGIEIWRTKKKFMIPTRKINRKENEVGPFQYVCCNLLSMRLIFFAYIWIFFLLKAGFSQVEYSGIVISQKDNKPIPYVNVGIINKNIGTVTNDKGYFKLIIPEKFFNDSIGFSCIGFKGKVLPINKLENSETEVILNPIVYTLPEAIVKYKKFKTKTKGCVLDYGIPASYAVDQLGNEIGVMIRLKGKPSVIKDLNIFIADNSCESDTLFFRVNIYRIKDDMPSENILTENILVKTVVKRGLLTVNLEKYNLYLDHDFIITIEWLRYFGEHCFYLRYRPVMTNDIFYGRVTSQGEWGKAAHMGFEFYVTIEQ